MSLRKPPKSATTVAIASGQTTSATYTVSPGATFGLVLPAAFTGTTISFLVSADNVTFQALYDTSNTAVSMTVAQGRSYQLPAALIAWPYWQVVSGASEAAGRSLVVVAQS